MEHTPELIVMLTHNDVTVPDAAAVFARCQHTRARYWGFKEEGLPFAEMQALFAQMKACGKRPVWRSSPTPSLNACTGPKWPLPAGVIF